MASFHFKNNFTAGELAPAVQGRTDLTAYKNGAALMENCLPTPQGGFFRRPGTRFVSRAGQNTAPKLIPFVVGTSQSYVVELGNTYARFHTLGGRLEESAQSVENAVDNGSGAIRITITGHGYTTGDQIAIRNVGGTTEANDDWTITVIDANNFDLNGSTFTNAYTSGGTANKIIEISTPWTAAEALEVRYAQDADRMFIVHKNHFPQELRRTGATTFTLTEVSNVINANNERWKLGPFQPLNNDATLTMDPSADTGTITVTASSAFFTADMVGMYMRIGGEVSGEQGVVRFTGFTSSTVMDAEVESQLSGGADPPATDNWALGSWGDETGFPSRITFYQQRLVLANTPTEPDTIWMSATGDFFSFKVGTEDDEPITFRVHASSENSIQWLTSLDDLIVGTTSEEYAVSGGAGNAITPSNIRTNNQSSHGSEDHRAYIIGPSVIFVQRGGRRLRAMSFSFDQDQFLADDLTILADHILADDVVVDIAVQQTPYPKVWLTTQSGLLVSVTMLREQQIVAWARHPFRTTDDALSLAVIPGAVFGENEEVWLATKRSINGGDRVYIEFMDFDNLDKSFVDCSIVETITPSTTITGLDHLEGESVGINGDGAVYPDETVSGGAITVEGPNITDAMIGLEFVPTVTPVTPEFELRDGPTYGRKKRFARYIIFADDTLTLQVDGDEAEARSTEDLMDEAPATPSLGVFTYSPPGSAERLEQTITQPLPIEMKVRAIFGEVEVGD